MDIAYYSYNRQLAPCLPGGLCALGFAGAGVQRHLAKELPALQRQPIPPGGTMAEDLAFLIYRTALGDQRAFERLYQQTSPRLYGLAMSILRRKDQAEDAIQEAFVNIWHSAGSYSPDKGSVQTWLNVIVRHRCIDRLRREPQRFSTLDDQDWEQFEHEGLTPLQELESDAEARLLARCLETLEDKQRESLSLAFFKGLTHSELASHLGAPLGTVKAWVRRGLERLRGCLHHEV